MQESKQKENHTMKLINLVLGAFVLMAHNPKNHAAAPEQSLSGTSFIIFSYHRPLQLYSLLESAQQYVTNIKQSYVLYRADTDRFESAYQEVKKSFPQVAFFRQGPNPHADFKPALLSLINNSPGDYILFAVDDIIVKDQINITQCERLMEQTNAYGFFFRLGLNITECYAIKAKHSLPAHKQVQDDVYQWRFVDGAYDWRYPNNVDMTLYRKTNILSPLKQQPYHNPNTLEGRWAGAMHVIGPKMTNKIGLFFEKSKIVNLPLNLVNTWANRCMHLYSAEQLLEKFEQGLKIDIKPLHTIDNKAPHMEYQPIFIKRT